MKWKLVAAGAIVGMTAAGASSCSSPTPDQGSVCTNDAGKQGKWITDESDSLKGGYTVIVSICVDESGRIIDLDVE